MLYKYSFGHWFILTSTAYANYCLFQEHTIRIKHCTTNSFSAQFLQICIRYCAYIEPIQSLIMQIRWFNMILNTVHFIILWFSRLSDTLILMAKVWYQCCLYSMNYVKLIRRIHAVQISICQFMKIRQKFYVKTDK